MLRENKDKKNKFPKQEYEKYIDKVVKKAYKLIERGKTDIEVVGYYFEPWKIFCSNTVYIPKRLIKYLDRDMKNRNWFCDQLNRKMNSQNLHCSVGISMLESGECLNLRVIVNPYD